MKIVDGRLVEISAEEPVLIFYESEVPDRRDGKPAFFLIQHSADPEKYCLCGTFPDGGRVSPLAIPKNVPRLWRGYRPRGVAESMARALNQMDASGLIDWTAPLMPICRQDLSNTDNEELVALIKEKQCLPTPPEPESV
ncbi:MAG: hypothetical protein AAB885_01560 [Patescibacteria group bacterium]